MRTLSKALVALLVASTAAIASPLPRQISGQATCTYLLVPDATVDANTDANLVAGFNYVIASSLAVFFSGAEIDGPGASWTDNGDNTFTVEDTRSVADKTADETAAALESFQGTTMTGFINNASITWTFGSVSCVV